MFSTVRRALHPRLGSDSFRKLPYTNINLRTTNPSTRSWVRDEHAVNLIYGRGWSAAIVPLREAHGIKKIHTFEEFLADEGGDQAVYVSITVPSPVKSARSALSALDGEFVRNLLSDPGLEGARCFSLYTSSRTITGREGAVLIGDASHGMVPFCGAGASAGIKDAVDLVDVIRKLTYYFHHQTFYPDESE